MNNNMNNNSSANMNSANMNSNSRNNAAMNNANMNSNNRNNAPMNNELPNSSSKNNAAMNNPLNLAAMSNPPISNNAMNSSSENPNSNEMRFAADAPYPPIQVAKENPQLGAWILDNVGGSNSEISTIALYVYNHYISNEEFKNVGKIFRKIAIVEMRHLDIFSELALRLGLEPRLWTLQNNRFRYWTPSYVNYALDLKTMIHRALNGELAAIEKYQKQIAGADDPNVAANLERVILDEEVHVSIFKKLIDTYKL